MSYYSVTVKVMSLFSFRETKETINFKSRWAARYMAKKYLECEDVMDVIVMDETTGEIIYHKERFGEEYDAYAE